MTSVTNDGCGGIPVLFGRRLHESVSWGIQQLDRWNFTDDARRRWVVDASTKLSPGDYRFRYVADGVWYTDYASHGIGPAHRLECGASGGATAGKDFVGDEDELELAAN